MTAFINLSYMSMETVISNNGAYHYLHSLLRYQAGQDYHRGITQPNDYRFQQVLKSRP